jgi:serine/threonine protein phosphatase PrpC
MNDRNPASWRWYSRQGTTCAENRDACGIFESTAYTFSVVVDASPRGERGVLFNTRWIMTVLDRLRPEVPSIASVLAALHAGQKRLRTERFFAEKASYAAFLLPREAKDAYVFCCGDCTLGARSPDGNIEWLTRTHTLANTFEDLGINADASERHILTRTLNAKRFQPMFTSYRRPLSDRGCWRRTDTAIENQTIVDSQRTIAVPSL